MSARRSNSNDSKRYYEWLDRAQTDLQSARLLLGVGGDPTAVIYHCHQVVEKALKGYLLFNANRHFDGHNITFLVKQCMRHSKEFDKFLEKSPPFNKYYIETRYPNDLPFEVGEKELSTAFKMSEELYRLVSKKIVYDLKDDIPVDKQQ
ncbi:MAG: HEPN domain-containing protein [Oscillospiraceae bacterium]|jgi:HEPN domain-containing protein|nr:HEPN domain-containing protein [Oscillospiraceae bacterium]